VCPHCIEPISRFDHFCPHCTRPVTAHASTDPLGQVFAQGSAYRRAAWGESPPRLVIVLGIWFIFAPPLVVQLSALTAFAVSLVVAGQVPDNWSGAPIFVGGNAFVEPNVIAIAIPSLVLGPPSAP
jgi:hypothetical protein